MGFDYLNESAVFFCAAMPAVSFSCDAGQSKVYAKGKPVLTMSAKIKPASKSMAQSKVCPILTAASAGSPQMCKCAITGWLNMGTAKAAGKTVLINRPGPANFCAVGSPILIRTSGVYGKVEQGLGLVNISPISWQQLYKDVEKADSAKADGIKNPSADAAEDVADIKDMNMTDTPDISDANIALDAAAIGGGAAAGELVQENRNKNKPVKSAAAETAVEVKNEAEEKAQNQPKPNLMCPYTDCEKCRNCAYPRASTDVNNDSQKLRQSYEAMDDADKDDYDRYYEQINEQYGMTRWTYAAHHIISGNQVFKPHQEIVRLANFYGYDINCAANCIFLVSKEDDYGSRVKSVSAYDAMSEAKMQWHLGGHSYSFDGETLDMLYRQIEARTHKQPQKPLKNYMQLLSDELGKMEQSLMNRRVCRNTPQQKAAFIRRMNNLSHKIKQQLAAFRHQPAQSYPYYVSKEAYLYTFGLPAATKVVFVQSVESAPDQITMHLFRIGRDKTQIADKGSKTFSLTDEKDRIECITFCANAEHFLFIEGDSVSEMTLPFAPEFHKKLPLVPLEADGYMRHYAADILVWLRDSQNPYTAPLSKINKRLKEVNSR